MKSPPFFLDLTFSSSFELDESSFEKSMSLNAAQARDMIFLKSLSLLLVPEATLLLVGILVVAVLVGVVELVLPLGTIGDEVVHVAALKASSRPFNSSLLLVLVHPLELSSE